MDAALHLLGLVVGVALIVWGAESFAKHLAVASARLGVTVFALGILLAGAEPEELVTSVTASLRHSPSIALGNVVGTNIAICLVAVGVGACVAALPFGRSVRRYAVLGLPLGAIAAWIAWDGSVGRLEGALLVAFYLAYVATIWAIERRPPTLGETAELAEAIEEVGDDTGTRRIGRELLLVLAGVAAMAVGAVAIVEGVRGLTSVEASQTTLALTIVGFATAFELVVLAFTSARHGVTEAVVAGVVGSFAYNVTMTLGAGALARPLRIVDATQLHGPWLLMLASLGLVIALGWQRGAITRRAGTLLLGAYPVAVVLLIRA
ncbi:MAG: sodium:calcium antiporter [Actinomycetes bacterium]